MKVLKMNLLLLILFSLITAICHAQTAKEYYGKGIDYAVAGKFDEAQQEFTKALAADPFYEPVKISLEILEDVLKQRIKTETALYMFKGGAYGNKRMFDEAIAQLKRVIEINPNYADGQNALAIAYYSKRKYSLAIKHCDRAIELGYSIDPKFLELLEPYRER